MHIEIFGYIAAICTTMSFLPQAIKMFKEKKGDGISTPMYVIFVLGVFFWLIYGIMLKSIPIIIANSITLFLSSSILIMKVKYD